MAVMTCMTTRVTTWLAVCAIGLSVARPASQYEPPSGAEPLLKITTWTQSGDDFSSQDTRAGRSLRWHCDEVVNDGVSDVPRVLLVQNASGSGPGRLPHWCAEAGVDVELLRAYDGETVPTSTDGYDAVVLLGGNLMPDADDEAPWLPRERELARAAVSDGTPFLGICLGGQILAHILGGEVLADFGLPEKGVTDIQLLAEAADDVLLQGFSLVPAIENHRDRITRLPEGSVWLASSERCPLQAFRVGDRAWGLQFHPECEASRVRSWDVAKIRDAGFDPEVLIAEADRRGDEVEQTWQRVVRRFLDLARDARTSAATAHTARSHP